MSVKVIQRVTITRTTRKIGSKTLESKNLTDVEFERKHPRGPDGRFIKKT